MPRAFSEREKLKIREALLEEGARLFTAHGLQKTNVEDLAQAAGIAKGSFYLFYDSKEAMFMAVIEEAEKRFREEVLAQIDQPGRSPRERLFAILKKAFTFWREIPVLQSFSPKDMVLLARKVDPDILKEHLAADRDFIKDLIRRCKESDIPITADEEKVGNLIYAIFFTSLHENDFALNNFSGTVSTLIDLVSAYCLGEIEMIDPGPNTEIESI